MPIVFEQQAPMAPEINRAAGATAQFNQTLPVLAQLQAQVGNAYQQAAALRQKGAMADADRLQTAATKQAALEFQAAEGAADRATRGGMQQASFGNAAATQERAADLQMQAEQTRLTRGEEVRLNRLREAQGSLQELVDNRQISESDAREMMVNLRTGLNPLERRRAASQMQMQDLQFRHETQRMDRENQLWERNERYRTTAAQNLVESVTDEETGIVHNFRRGADGTLTPLGNSAGWTSSGGNTGGSGTGGGGAGGTGGGRGGNNNVRDTVAISRQAEQNAERSAPIDPATGRRRPPTAEEIANEETRLLALARIEERTPDRAAVRQQAWREVRQNRPNMPVAERHQLVDMLTDARMADIQQSVVPNARAALTEIVRGQARSRTGVTPENLHSATLATTPAGISQEVERQLRSHFGTRYTPPPQPNQQNQPQSGRPNTVDFDFANPTAEQRPVVTGLNTWREQLRSATNLNPQQRERYLGMVNEMQGMLTEYGSDTAAWQPWQRNAYARRRDEVLRVARASATPQAATDRPSIMGAQLNEIRGAPERLWRLFNGPQQRPFGANPYE